MDVVIPKETFLLDDILSPEDTQKFDTLLKQWESEGVEPEIIKSRFEQIWPGINLVWTTK